MKEFCTNPVRFLKNCRKNFERQERGLLSRQTLPLIWPEALQNRAEGVSAAGMALLCISERATERRRDLPVICALAEAFLWNEGLLIALRRFSLFLCFGRHAVVLPLRYGGEAKTVQSAVFYNHPFLLIFPIFSAVMKPVCFAKFFYMHFQPSFYNICRNFLRMGRENFRR